MATTVEFTANPFIVAFRSAGAAWAANKTWDPPAKCRVVDAWIVLTGAAAGTIKLTNAVGDICDAVTLATSDKDIQSIAMIDDAQRDLVPGTNVLTLVPATSPIGDVFVLLQWIE